MVLGQTLVKHSAGINWELGKWIVVPESEDYCSKPVSVN